MFVRALLAGVFALLLRVGAGAQEGPVTSVVAPEVPLQRGVARPSVAVAPRVSVPQPKPGESDASAIQPTWETQSQARTFFLSVPAPRGQIVDRHGEPLAQTRVSTGLALIFPTPLNWRPERALAFAREQIRVAEALLGTTITVEDDFVLKHYTNRGMLPMDLAHDLPQEMIGRIGGRLGPYLAFRPVYVRHYPHGALAAHVIGYAGRAGRSLEQPVQNNDPLFPASQGREGLEQTFDAQLTGKPGQVNYAFDANGRKASERTTIPPQPGNNVVTTLDLGLQALCENVLAKGTKRGALVVVDPRNGDVLALASWPTYDLNQFVPAISKEAFERLNNDPSVPLLPRAYRSAYPPGSTFKTFVGLAALEERKISPESSFECPPAFNVGNLVFRNWKKTHAGSLNFAEALTQSCNTWFYQVGILTGGKAISDWAMRCGLGVRTGLPLASEAAGRIPTDEYMEKVYGRKLLRGDVANLSIGQGDTLVSPLQMALAMAAIGNGGTVLQARLVQQVQTFDNRVVAGYEPRARGYITMSESTKKAMRKALLGVVESGAGTAGQAAVKGVRLGGKTGTAQWGPKHKERTAAWFCGYAPIDEPRYAFAAVYEGDPGSDPHGGTHAAPLIGKVFREVFKQEAEAKKSAGQKAKAEQADREEKSRDEMLEEERMKEIERQSQDEN